MNLLNIKKDNPKNGCLFLLLKETLILILFAGSFLSEESR